ncbi:MAG TPA: Fur family transcriptional regulator [Solirubrobacteraceae bacterium]|jgi:Fe2+ or Zn2+ uptake regulation protein
MASGELDDILISKLKERGQRVTPQRLVIHRAMAERDQHLTAEQVLEMVSSRLPGTSLPTVYATLELFEKLGLIRRISSASGASLFDSRTSPHAHAICRGCGAVADIELVDASLEGSLDALASGIERGFSADHAEVLIWGSCTACATQLTAVS